MLPRPPLVTIITVCYNSAHLLEGTIRSVLAQSYPHIEYLVIDGASTDHTATIIGLMENLNHRLLNAKVFKTISEPDKGLYDAMNKGLRMASGDFVLFLNAGDRLFETDTIKNMMEHCTADTDVLYGEVMLVSESRRHLGTRSQMTTRKLPENLTWKSLKKGMVVCHQAFMARTSIAPQYIENNLAADIDWVISILKKSRRTVNTHLIVAEYLVGGLSRKRHRQSLKDRFAVMRRHYGLPATLWAHFLIFFRSFFKKDAVA